MLRVREGPKGRIMHCMFRVPSFRFRRSLSVQNIKQFDDNSPLEGWDQYDLLMRLANRAIYFHSLITVNQGKPQGTLDGLEVVPLNAGIHLESDSAN